MSKIKTKTMHDLSVNHKFDAIAAAKRLRPLAHLKAVIDNTPPTTAKLNWLKAGDITPHQPEIIESDSDDLSVLQQAAMIQSPGICITQSSSLDSLQESILLETCANQGIPALIRDHFLDEYQIYVVRAARAAGMVIPLLPIDLALAQYFVEIGRDLGLEACLQCDDGAQLEIALKTDAPIVLINPNSARTHTDMLQRARQSEDILPRVWLERRRIMLKDDAQDKAAVVHVYSRCLL